MDIHSSDLRCLIFITNLPREVSVTIVLTSDMDKATLFTVAADFKMRKHLSLLYLDWVY